MLEKERGESVLYDDVFKEELSDDCRDSFISRLDRDAADVIVREDVDEEVDARRSGAATSRSSSDMECTDPLDTEPSPKIKTQ